MKETSSSYDPPEKEPDDLPVHEHRFQTPEVHEIPRILWAVEFDDFVGEPE